MNYPIILYYRYPKSGLMTLEEFTDKTVNNPNMKQDWEDLCEWYESLKKMTPTFSKYRQNIIESVGYNYKQYIDAHLLNGYVELPDKESVFRFLDEGKAKKWYIYISDDMLEQIKYDPVQIYQQREKPIVTGKIDTQTVMSNDIKKLLKD